MKVHLECTSSPLALSGNFQEGETHNEGVHDGEIDGGDAWVKESFSDGDFWE